MCACTYIFIYIYTYIYIYIYICTCVSIPFHSPMVQPSPACLPSTYGSRSRRPETELQCFRAERAEQRTNFVDRRTGDIHHLYYGNPLENRGFSWWLNGILWGLLCDYKVYQWPCQAPKLELPTIVLRPS